MNVVEMYNRRYSHRAQALKTRAEWIAAFVDDMSKVTVELD